VTGRAIGRALRLLMATAVVAAIITQLNQQLTLLTFRQGLVFLVYPIGYLAYSMIRGPIVDRYPYPFLDPRINGYTFVAVMSLFVAVVALAAAWLLCWTSRRDFGRSAQDAPGDAESPALPSR